MKTLDRFRMIAGGTMTTLLLGACGVEESDYQPRDTLVAFPILRTLTDNRGRPLDVKLIGRSKTHVTFMRSKDGKYSRYPIESLSDSDRAFVLSLPLLEAPSIENLNRRAETERKLKSLEEELADINDKAREPDMTEYQSRWLEKQREDIEERMGALQDALKQIDRR